MLTITTPEQMREAAIAAVENERTKAQTMFSHLDHYDLYFDGLDDALIRIHAIPIAPQPVAVTVNPLVWDADIDIGYSSKEPPLRSIIQVYYRSFFDADMAKTLADKYINAFALTIQPADPLSDPRVKAMVEAATKVADAYYDAAWEGDELPMQQLDAALRAIGGEA